MTSPSGAVFSSHSTFSRAFRKYYGVTPEHFRTLTNEEVSKIGTLKPNKSTHFDLEPPEFWTLDLMDEEIAGLQEGLNIEVKTICSLKVAFMETHLGDVDAIPNAFKVITKWAKAQGSDQTGNSVYRDLTGHAFFYSL